jgi:hypothetical protein
MRTELVVTLVLVLALNDPSKSPESNELKQARAFCPG